MPKENVRYTLKQWESTTYLIYKIGKEETCAAVSCKFEIPKQTSRWIKQKYLR